MTHDAAVYDIQNRLFCECGKRRMRSPSGMVCPDGHGKIHAPVSNSELRAYEFWKWSQHMPRARHAQINYLVDGKKGVWRQCPHSSTRTRRVLVGSKADPKAVLAVVIPSGRVRQFIPGLRKRRQKKG